MIAEQDSKIRFQVITRMTLANSEKSAEIKALQAQLEAERARANMAEAQVRQLEAQLTTPKKDVFTLSMPITRPEDRVKADADLAKKLSDGWERFDSTVIANSGESTVRIVTLVRPAPTAPVRPEQSVAATDSVAAEATNPTPPATPDPEPESLPVTRKTVTASAIFEPGEAPAPAADEPEGESPEIPVEPSPVKPTTRGEEIKAGAEKAYNAALTRNKLPAYKPIPTYKPD